MMFSPWQLAAAYVLDLLAGDPSWLPHPVRWIGRLISWAENNLYDASASPWLLRSAGFLLWVLVIAVVVAATEAVTGLSHQFGQIVGGIVLVWLAFTTLATRSLHKESARVIREIERGDLELARYQLSRIVSRDTSNLDEAGILRAVVETISENISDGIVAPLFYLAIFGPVGALVYKAVNTMDSMLGYMNERYRYFGWFPARADDVANWIPARLTGWLVVGAAVCLGRDWRQAVRIMLRDARKMKSPNAGYPEAAAAGALGVQLGGTNIYFGEPVEKPRLGDPTEPITRETCRRMTRLMYATSALAFFMAFCILLCKQVLGA